MALIYRRHLVRLEREVDIFIARELAAALASREGFDIYQASDIETAISELASNTLKYGERGWASLRIDRTGFEAVVTDEGPGFGAAPKSPTGLGVGLAGVERLMDSMEIESLNEGGQVTVRKDLHRTNVADMPPQWEINIAGRTRSGRSVSGDACWVADAGKSLLVAVIDGLGAGEGAAHASTTVIECFETSHPGTQIDEMILSAHQHARSTRGAVCLLARIDLESQTVECTGVGDVAGFIDPPGEHIVLSPGILGVDDPKMRSSQFPWTDCSRLVVWTDGIKLSTPEVSQPAAPMPTGDWAEKMAAEYGVDRDDGLILTAHRASTE